MARTPRQRRIRQRGGARPLAARMRQWGCRLEVRRGDYRQSKNQAAQGWERYLAVPSLSLTLSFSSSSLSLGGRARRREASSGYGAPGSAWIQRRGGGPRTSAVRGKRWPTPLGHAGSGGVTAARAPRQRRIRQRGGARPSAERMQRWGCRLEVRRGDYLQCEGGAASRRCDSVGGWWIYLFPSFL